MVSRDPSDYRPTTHALQMRRDRNIEWGDVGTTIETGTVQLSDARVSHQREFVETFPWYDYPVGVVVDTETQEIVTVEFRK